MSQATEEINARVKELWLAGIPYPEMAVAINAEFGGARTRNAIAGMVHRMKLRDGASKRSPAHRCARSAPPVKKRAGKAALSAPAPLAIVTLAPKVVPEAVPPISCVPFSSAFPAKSCRWPIGAGFSMMICGAAQREGSSYCPTHHRIAYVPAEKRRAA